MKRIRFCLLLFAAMSWLQLSTSASLFAAQHEHGSKGGHKGEHSQAAKGEQALKLGKTGAIEFTDETRVGSLTLKPGKYQFQHRVEGSDHFVHFTQVTKPLPSSGSGGGVPKAHPGEVKCKVEPLNKKISQTTVYSKKEDGFRRVTRLEVRGENAAHLLTPVE
ncbi:MAG: hypothetical protein AB1898_11035 [Acidobacteriota bacterium]